MTGQPTAVDVLGAHQDGDGYTHDDDTLCTCDTWVGGRALRNTPGRRSLAEHQVDMLAAAELLVTPEHDAQVAARALQQAIGAVHGLSYDSSQPERVQAVQDALGAIRSLLAQVEHRKTQEVARD